MTDSPKMEIDCPKCGARFALDDIYTSKIEDRYKKEFQTKEKELLKRQDEIKDKEEQLTKTKESLDDEIKKGIAKEREKLTSQIKLQAKEEVTVALRDLEQQLQDRNKKLDEANQKELEFIQKRREIEDKEKTLELEIQRQVDVQSKKTSLATQQEYDNKIKLMQKEHETKEESLKHKVEELSKKLEQGSQQAQGEALELALEDELKSLFPFDTIVPVPKGVTGADLIQTVNNHQGKSCGTIIWEFKNTKNWTDSWIGKLKDDQRQVKADIGIILTSTLPKDVKTFEYVDGVWVTNIISYVGLCKAIRMSLIQLYSTKQANLGKNEKMEFIFQYLSGNEFKQRIQTIVEAFQSMKMDLEKEKIAMTKIWAKREKEIQRVIAGTMGMHGDLEGIIGNTLPKIEGVELDALSESTTVFIEKNME